MARAALNAGVKRIRPAIGCWFRGDAARAGPTPRQGRYIACSGPTPEPEFLGRRISNWWLKGGAKMQTKKRAADRCKRPAAKNHVMTSHDIRWLGYPIRFGARDQGSANVRGSTER